MCLPGPFPHPAPAHFNHRGPAAATRDSCRQSYLTSPWPGSKVEIGSTGRCNLLLLDAPGMESTRWSRLAVLYASTIFLSAFLLFQVQPLISRFILPWFGGGPAVWTTCLLFFQTVLFAGYAYAHASEHYFGPKARTIVHLTLIGAALSTLPITPSDWWKPEDSGYPTTRILALLAVCVGCPTSFWRRPVRWFRPGSVKRCPAGLLIGFTHCRISDRSWRC